MARAVPALAAAAALACGAEQAGSGRAAQPATGQACLPGLVSECPCSDGSRGVAVCDDLGIAFGTCTCAGGAQPVQPVGGAQAGPPTAGEQAPTAGTAGLPAGGVAGSQVGEPP